MKKPERFIGRMIRPTKQVPQGRLKRTLVVPMGLGKTNAPEPAINRRPTFVASPRDAHDKTGISSIQPSTAASLKRITGALYIREHGSAAPDCPWHPTSKNLPGRVLAAKA